MVFCVDYAKNDEKQERTLSSLSGFPIQGAFSESHLGVGQHCRSISQAMGSATMAEPMLRRTDRQTARKPASQPSSNQPTHPPQPTNQPTNQPEPRAPPAHRPRTARAPPAHRPRTARAPPARVRLQSGSVSRFCHTCCLLRFSELSAGELVLGQACEKVRLHSGSEFPFCRSCCLLRFSLRNAGVERSEPVVG